MEDIVFSASIDKGGAGAKSLQDLKKEFKELQTELSKTKTGTEEYSKTLQKLGAVKDDIGDLRDTINALNPEGKVQAFSNVAGKLAGGFQAATGAAALFGGKAEELEKTLLKVQAATALAQGIQSVVGLGDAFAVLGQVIKANPIFLLVGVIAAITAGYVKLSAAFSDGAKETERLNLALEKQKEISSAQIKIIDREILLLEAQGASEEKILEVKKRKVAFQIKELEASIAVQKNTLGEIENNKTLYESYLSVITGIQRKLGADKYADITQDMLDKNKLERSKETSDKLKVNEQAILDLKTSLLVEETKIEVKKRSEYKKTADEKAKIASEAQAREAAVLNAAIDAEEKAAKDLKLARAKQATDAAIQNAAIDAKEKEDKDQAEVDAYNERVKRNGKEFEDKQAARTEELRLEKEQSVALNQIKSNGLQAFQSLSELYFTFQRNSAKGNAAEELKIRRQQFQVEKAFNATRATIDGFRAVNAALTIPPPFGPALAIINGIAAAANVAKILATQFNPGSAPSANSGGGGPSSSPPAPTVQPAPTIQPTTRLNERGQNQDIRVVAEVVETQSTAAQFRVKRLENQASFP